MNESMLVDHFGELVVGLVLVVFGFAFKRWADAIGGTSEKILTKLEILAGEFHKHRLETENRVTKCETKVERYEVERNRSQ